MTHCSVPDRIQRFIARNVFEPPAVVRGVCLEQKGEMRLGDDKPWLPFTAEQWMDAATTAFCWHARVRMAPLVTAVVEDAFEDGRGRLDAKVWGVIPVAHARGLEVDRGEVQRYLAELPWNPMAFLHNPTLEFAEGSDGPVRVWCGDPDTYVDFRFDEAGDIVGTFSRTRSRGEDGPLPWEGRFGSYADFGGVRVPTQAEVLWHTQAGPAVYWHGEVTRLTWRE